MRRWFVLVLLLQGILTAEDELAKPAGISIHTWVREDIFAGWIANDNEQLAIGNRKLDRFLADHPDDRNALAWKFLVASQAMILARAKGDNAAYTADLAEAQAIRAKALPPGVPVTGAMISAYIIMSSSLIRTALIAPEADSTWMLRDAREMLLKIPELQGPGFDRLPAHMRGELWAQEAFVAGRLGDSKLRETALQNILTKLPGTPYEARAKAWEKPGAIAKEKDYTCLSCHEPGRLAPALARVNAAKAQ